MFLQKNSPNLPHDSETFRCPLRAKKFTAGRGEKFKETGRIDKHRLNQVLNFLSVKWHNLLGRVRRNES